MNASLNAHAASSWRIAISRTMDGVRWQEMIDGDLSLDRSVCVS